MKKCIVFLAAIALAGSAPAALKPGDSLTPYTIKNVENGKEYIITMHGKPVARITGVRESARQTIRETIDALMDFRKDHKATHAEIHEWVKEGRRF